MIQRKIILSVHLSLSSAAQLSLESNYFGFSKAISPKRSRSNKKKGHQKTRVDGESIRGESHLQGPQRPDFHCVDVSKKIFNHFKSFSTSQWKVDFKVHFCWKRRQLGRLPPSGSVQFQLPAGRQYVLVVLRTWVIIKMPEASGIRFQHPEEPALFAEKHAVTAFHLVSNILLSGFDLLYFVFQLSFL